MVERRIKEGQGSVPGRQKPKESQLAETEEVAAHHVRRFLQLKRQRSARRMQDARRHVETLNGAVGLGNRLSYMYGTALAWN